MAASLTLIDGAVLEGGGQILRNAAALSCLLKTPITVNNIRAGRNNPGLRPQHLTGLELISRLCNGKLEGGGVGSTEISFHPGVIKSGSYTADTKTAGSICLLIQAALPCLFYAEAPSQLLLKGGTNADMAPQIDYLTMVFKPMAERFGIHFDCDITRRGYYPKGGGEVVLHAQPVQSISPIDLTDPGEVVRFTGRAFTAGAVPKKVGHIMAGVAKDIVKSKYPNVPVEIEAVREPEHLAFGTGTGIMVIAETSTGCLMAGSALGKRGVRAEEVGQNAADMLLTNLSHGGCVDEFLQDQFILLMALGKGKSRMRCGPLTLHTKTAIYIAESLTQAKFSVTEISSDVNLIECDGIGFENRQI